MDYDVVIVGLGAMGSAAAFQLARRGVRVLGLEQFDIPHSRGSSHGYSRMIRTAYHEHPDYVPLLRRAYELWHEIEKISGQKLLHITGGLYMGDPRGEMIIGASGAAKQHKIDYEMLTREELARRFPQFQVPENFVAMLESQAGFLTPEKCIATFADQAMRHGAEVHGHEPVHFWKADDSGVAVTTSRGTYRARHVVFSGGAWTSKIVEDLGIPLRVTRQVLGWVWPRKPELFAYGKQPVWAIGHEDGSLHYGFPMMSDNPGFKIALHFPAQVTDPDKIVREVQAGDEETFLPAIRRFIPDADGPVLAIRICMYTNSPDSHFLIGAHPRHRNVTMACGFSGHGFKFSSVVGEVLADLAAEGKTKLPVGFLGLERFTR